MSYYCIFPDSTEFPVPLYPVIALILCTGLYTALFQFTLQKIIENIFALSNSLDHVKRTIFYLFLINFPLIALIVTTLVYNRSLIGFLISIDIDIIQIIIVSTYICHVEESRQTPLRGFLFVRDLFVLIGFLGSMFNVYYTGKPEISYGFILLGFYFFYYISQAFEQQLEDGALRLFKLKQNITYNSNFLLTQTWKQADYLGLKQIIKENHQQVKQDINELKEIFNNVVPLIDERLILINFSKIFMPYVTASRIDSQKTVEYYEKLYDDEFQSDEPYYESNTPSATEENIKDPFDNLHNQSQIQIFNRNTLTEDYVVEEDDIIKDQSKFQNVLKYSFYPIYMISFVSGRLRYLLDYISFFLLLGCMWVIGNSSYYFAYHTNNRSYLFVSIIVTGIMSIPPSRYYLKISMFNDFDFINIFMQSSILKSLIFGIAITIIAFADPEFTLYGSMGLMLSIAGCLLTYLAYGFLLIGQKFATLKSNFNYVIGITICSYILRLALQLSISFLYSP